MRACGWPPKRLVKICICLAFGLPSRAVNATIFPFAVSTYGFLCEPIWTWKPVMPPIAWQLSGQMAVGNAASEGWPTSWVVAPAGAASARTAQHEIVVAMRLTPGIEHDIAVGVAVTFPMHGFLRAVRARRSRAGGPRFRRCRPRRDARCARRLRARSRRSRRRGSRGYPDRAGPRSGPPAEQLVNGHPQDLGLREQAAFVASGELDPSELLAHTLARITERHAELSSIVARCPEESERMLAAAPDGPLRGVPVAIKDMFQLPWRGPRDGSFREELPPGESAIYRRLRDAGAVVVGVTNMHFWGGGSTGAQSAYGPVGNPWDVKACGGGSSGGSAASVGARLVAGAIGTDGGGSIRLPGSYCGVTGLKLTYGTVPRDGYTHGSASRGAAGPMCRAAADARLLAGVLTAREIPAGDGAKTRVGIVRSPFWENLDPEVDQACRELLGASGWEVEDISLAGAEHVTAATILRLSLEGLPSISRDELAEAPPLARSVTKWQMILPARNLLQADRVRALLRRELVRAFESCDGLVWPTTPAPAPPIENPAYNLPHGETPVDVANVRQAGIGNLGGIPGITVPAGTHSSGLPMGTPLLAPWGHGATPLDAAEHIESVTDREFVDAVPPMAAAAPA